MPAPELEQLCHVSAPGVNAKQAAALMAARPGATAEDPELAQMEQRIVAELLAVPAYGLMPHPELTAPDGTRAIEQVLGAGSSGPSSSARSWPCCRR